MSLNRIRCFNCRVELLAGLPVHNLFAAGQFKTKHGTLARSADNGGFCVMTFQNGLHERQPQAGTTLFPAATLINTVETLKNSVDVLRRNALALIDDRHGYKLFPLIKVNHNFTVLVRVVDGIGSQAAPYLAGSFRVGVGRRRAVTLDPQPNATLRSLCLKLLQYRLGELVKIDAFETHPN